MKKSEVVTIIADFLEECGLDEFREETEDTADCLLTRLEKLGMLPPETTEPSKMPGIADFKVRKWEKE